MTTESAQTLLMHNEIRCIGCNSIVLQNRAKTKKFCSKSCSGKFRHKSNYVKTFKPRTCKFCESLVNKGRKYCDPCLVIHYQNQSVNQRIHPVESDHRRIRRERERQMPGLSRVYRRRLLQDWKLKNLKCLYCSAVVETVDHIIPLTRGGTNFEGNLAPACRKCNSSKATKLLIEWRNRANA